MIDYASYVIGCLVVGFAFMSFMAASVIIDGLKYERYLRQKKLLDDYAKWELDRRIGRL